MITLYTGTPGSGKTYHCAAVIYDALLVDHKNVISNFSVDLSCYPEKYRSKLGEFVFIDTFKLSPKFLETWAIEHNSMITKGGQIREGQTLVVIDEAQLILGSRQWQLASRMEWLEFFSLHRKYGYDVILISQSDRMLDKQVRCLCEYEEKHRKASNFGKVGKVMGVVGGGSLFCVSKFWYGVHERIDTKFIRPSKKIFAFYDSYKILSAQVQPAGDEGSRSGGPRGAGRPVLCRVE